MAEWRNTTHDWASGVDRDGTTGTTVRFLPDPAVGTTERLSAPELRQQSRTAWPHLTLDVVDERRAGSSGSAVGRRPGRRRSPRTKACPESPKL